MSRDEEALRTAIAVYDSGASMLVEQAHRMPREHIADVEASIAALAIAIATRAPTQAVLAATEAVIKVIFRMHRELWA